MEHKLISGGEQWLPFARSRIKALKALGGKYATQRFVMSDGATVMVQLVDGVERIEIKGDGADRCVLPNIAYATTVTLDGAGKEIPRTEVATTKGLRTGVHDVGFNSGALGDYITPSPVVWGTSPMSDKNIEARSAQTDLVQGGRDARVYIDGVLADTSPASYSLVGDIYNNIEVQRRNWIVGCVARSDVAAVLVQTRNKTTQRAGGSFQLFRRSGNLVNDEINASFTTSGSTDSNFYLSDYALDINGDKIPKPVGGFEFTHRKVIGKQTTFSGSSSTTRSYSDYAYDSGAATVLPQTCTTTNAAHLPEQTVSTAFVTSDKNKNLILGTEQVVTDIVGGGTESGVGAWTVDVTTTTTRTHSAKVTFIEASGVAQEEAHSLDSTYVSVNTVTASTNVTVVSGDALVLRGLVAGDKSVCVGYSLVTYPPPLVTTDYLDVIDYTTVNGVRTFTKRKTINLGIRTNALNSGYNKLRGAAMRTGDYIWCTRYCFNIETEQYIEIPGYIDGSLLTVNSNGQTSPNTDANYLVPSRRGKTMTYYWLHLNQANIDNINANVALTYPLSGGIIKRYSVSGNPGAEVVEEVLIDFPIPIVGTSKDSGNDLNGATLQFA